MAFVLQPALLCAHVLCVHRLCGYMLAMGVDDYLLNDVNMAVTLWLGYTKQSIAFVLNLFSQHAS